MLNRIFSEVSVSNTTQESYNDSRRHEYSSFPIWTKRTWLARYKLYHWDLKTLSEQEIILHSAIDCVNHGDLGYKIDSRHDGRKPKRLESDSTMTDMFVMVPEVNEDNTQQLNQSAVLRNFPQEIPPSDVANSRKVSERHT